MAGTSQAAQFRRLEVVERDGHYHAEIEARIDAPAEAAWKILSEFSRLPEISPAVQESETLGRAGPHAWMVRTRSLVCVLWFCRKIRQVQRIQLAEPGSMRADVDPEQSDFDDGLALWRLEGEGGATLLRFYARIKPRFALPPWIGSWLVKRAVREEARGSVLNLERLAREALK